jgi:HlyD family secretion protein
MTKRRIWILSGAALVVTAALGFLLLPRRSAAPTYRFATIERGDLEATISTTGKLHAVTTVQVGTQVSGQVSAIFADFNDRVKKGQLVAKIDPVLQQQAVREAEASLERNRAEMVKAQRDFERDQGLHERQMLSDSDFSSSEYALAVAKANLKSGEVALERARRNLAYTSIHAPIDGIVIERNVDVGQTVAASLSAPQLFLIANDLSQMQILASVDESDVGRIHEGQPVSFTVQAAPGERFTGTVRQVRLQSATVENVVSYTVVIGVQNPSGRLLPGMTATVLFLTGTAKDVLLVPNAALRIRPTDAMLAEAGGARQNRRQAGGNREAANSRARADTLLWYQGPNGRLRNTRVRVGLSDGQKTEVAAEGIDAGTRVLIGIATQRATGAGANASPFQQQQQRPGGPGPPGSF